jgi:hypothetical protein
MFAQLHERIYLLSILLIALPATIYFLVIPLYKAQREQNRTVRSSNIKRRRSHSVTATTLGTLTGWLAFRFLPETLVATFIFGAAFAAIALVWYLAISANAFQFSSWHPFFGFGRPVPAEMAKPIHAPVALPMLLFVAGGLLGFILHILSAVGA